MIRIVGTALYQWDTGRYVTTDIEADHIHFSNKGDSKAVIMDLANSQAKIPDYLLQTGKQLCVYVVRNRVTVESRVFSVTLRECPAEYIYEEDQRNFVYELIADAQAATEAASQAAKEASDVADAIKEDAASGKFKGEKGEKGDPGEQGPKGDKGDPGDDGDAINDSVISKDYSWSSQNTVDKLCPSFKESGSVVVCEPLEGYPLEVISFFTTNDGELLENITLNQSNNSGFSDGVSLTVDFFGSPDGGVSYGYYNWTTGLLYTDNYFYQHYPDTNSYVELNDETEANTVVRNIYALPGKNYFRSDCGDTEVKGRLDPTKNSCVNDAAVSDKAWSSKNTVDKLCPSFKESGSVVVCEPLEGYPLEVVSTINENEDGSSWDGIKLTQCGKNFIGYDDYSGVSSTGRIAECTDGMHKIQIYDNLTTTWVIANAAAYMKGGYLVPGTYVFSINQKSTTDRFFKGCYATVTLEDGTIANLPDGTAVTLTQSGTVSGIRCASTAITHGTVITVTLQIEAGSVATAYEPYQGQTFIADLSNKPVFEGSYNWTTGVLVDDAGSRFQHDLETNTFTDVDNEIDSEGYIQPIVRNIPALPGLNYLYSDCGNTEVKGKADPVIIIEKQEARLAALEAAIINNT